MRRDAQQCDDDGMTMGALCLVELFPLLLYQFNVAWDDDEVRGSFGCDEMV